MLVFGSSPICLPLHSGFSARLISHVSLSCLHLSPPYLPGCPHSSSTTRYTVSLLSHLSPLSCVPLHFGCFECFGPHDFAPVSRVSTLWILCTQTGLSVRGSYSFERGSCSGRMILHLPPGKQNFRLVSGCSGPVPG